MLKFMFRKLSVKKDSNSVFIVLNYVYLVLKYNKDEIGRKQNQKNP